MPENRLLTDWFDRVYVINCSHRPDRLKAIEKEIRRSGIADWNKVKIFRAIIGDWTTAPADWNSGYGAWGCLASHRRLLEDVLHDRDDRYSLNVRNYLVLEDDVFFVDDAVEKLNQFMKAVPDNWDQIYLGGQHRRNPEPSGIDGMLLGKSVHRTHAYAISERIYQRFYRHICYASDYRNTTKHIDHQLELAHRRGDWTVYCPADWIAGQEAGASNIGDGHSTRQLWNA